MTSFYDMDSEYKAIPNLTRVNKVSKIWKSLLAKTVIVKLRIVKNPKAIDKITKFYLN